MVINDDDLKYLEVFKNIKKEFKNRPLIILIHGFAIDHRCFRLFEQKIKENNYLSFNLPGCGSLKKYPIKYLTLRGMCDLVIKYIESKNIDNIILLGHSLGGAIANVVAANIPERIRATILLSPFNKTSIPKLINKINKFNIKDYKTFYNLQKEIFVHPDEMLRMIEDHHDYFNEVVLFFKENSKFLHKTMISIANLSTLIYLDINFKKNKTKTLLLLGENDKFINVKASLKYFETITPHIETYIFKNTGHAFFVEDSKSFTKIIFSFIKNIEYENK